MKKTEKKINHMIVPILNGIEHLDNYNETQFPVYVSAYVAGLDIVISKGQVYLAGMEKHLKNINFKESLFNLREISIDPRRKFTFHCTIYSPTLNVSDLYALALSGGMLPKDAVIYVDDTVIDRYSDVMVTEARVANLNNLSKTLDIEDTHFNTAMPVNNLKSLYNAIDLLMKTNPDFAGIKIWAPKGKYHEGLPTTMPSVVRIDTTSTEEVEIVDIEPKRLHIGTDNVMAANTLTLESGSELPDVIDLNNLSRQAKVDIWGYRKNLVGTKVVNQLVSSPGCNTIVRKTCVKFII